VPAYAVRSRKWGPQTSRPETTNNTFLALLVHRLGQPPSAPRQFTAHSSPRCIPAPHLPAHRDATPSSYTCCIRRTARMATQDGAFAGGTAGPRSTQNTQYDAIGSKYGDIKSKPATQPGDVKGKRCLGASRCFSLLCPHLRARLHARACRASIVPYR
jgi:hypothetical protein